MARLSRHVPCWWKARGPVRHKIFGRYAVWELKRMRLWSEVEFGYWEEHMRTRLFYPYSHDPVATPPRKEV